MRHLAPALTLMLLLAGCNAGGNSPALQAATQQLLNDAGTIAGSLAVPACAQLTKGSAPLTQSCATLAGDTITVGQAAAQGLLAGKPAKK